MPRTPFVAVTLTEAITHRRSIRSYSPEPIGDASVRVLLDAAVQAPTAMHAEPWVFAPHSSVTPTSRKSRS